MVDEAKRWESLAQEHYQPFIGEDGLLNEFAMMWALRERFPLHLIVFKQTACGVPHEGGVENLFSRAGLLSDPNMPMRRVWVVYRQPTSSRARAEG